MARHTLIIGNGIAGITAARHLRMRSDDDITVVSAETDHPYSRPALMYIYMGHMPYESTKLYEDWFWVKNRIHTIRDYVTGVDIEARTAQLAQTGAIGYDRLVIATGSRSNLVGWPGENLRGAQGFINYQDVQLLEENTRGIERGVVVGGGLIGIEVAEMLLSRKIAATFLIRDAAFWGKFLSPQESDLVCRHMRSHHVDLRLSTDLKEILADGSGRVRAVRTGTGEEIACQTVVLAAGVRPNVSLAETCGIECDRGILVDHQFRTSAPHVYAAGDCAQFRDPLPGRQPIEQVWYTGKIHGETLGAILAGEERQYEPGVWFNSAKFMDIEYQTYGQIAGELPEGEAAVFWEGENRSIRISYSRESGHVTGVNLLGIRSRQQVWERWIGEKTPVREVLAGLRMANFDPEFQKAFEPALIAAWNAEHPDEPVVLERGNFFTRFLKPRREAA